ncbi:CynX/NimT family MFS transporter [Chloroflexota bacterium]
MLWLLYTAAGLVTRSLAPLVTPIIRDLNMSYSQMGIVLGSWQLTYIVVAIIAGTIIDNWGVRRTLFIGTIIIGLSTSLRYFADGFGSLLFIVALYGVGGPMISIGSPKTISLWFKGKDRGTAVGIYSTGPRIGGLIAFSATNSIVMPLTGYSWRLTYVCYGIFAFAISLLWLLLARDIKQKGEAESANMVRVFVTLTRVRNVRVILIAGFLCFTVMHGFNNWLPKILESGNFSPTIAGFVASVSLVVGIPAVLIFPRMIPPHLRGRWMALLALLVAVSLLVSVTTSGVLLFAGLVLFGMAGASLLPLLVLVLMDTPEVGSRHMGSAGGIFFCVSEIGGFAGPAIMGALVDMTGSFLPGIVFLASLTLVIFAVMFLLRPPFISDQESL